MIYAGVQEPVVTRKNIRKTELQLINSDNGDHGKQKKKEKTTGGPTLQAVASCKFKGHR